MSFRQLPPQTVVLGAMPVTPEPRPQPIIVDRPIYIDRYVHVPVPMGVDLSLPDIPEDANRVEIGRRRLAPEIVSVKKRQTKPERQVAEFPYHHPLPEQGCNFVHNYLQVNGTSEYGLHTDQVAGPFSAAMAAFKGLF